jgi:hypothetical protein
MGTLLDPSTATVKQQHNKFYQVLAPNEATNNEALNNTPVHFEKFILE